MQLLEGFLLNAPREVRIVGRGPPDENSRAISGALAPEIVAVDARRLDVNLRRKAPDVGHPLDGVLGQLARPSQLRISPCHHPGFFPFSSPASLSLSLSIYYLSISLSLLYTSVGSSFALPQCPLPSLL